MRGMWFTGRSCQILVQEKNCDRDQPAPDSSTVARGITSHLRVSHVARTLRATPPSPRLWRASRAARPGWHRGRAQGAGQCEPPSQASSAGRPRRKSGHASLTPASGRAGPLSDPEVARSLTCRRICSPGPATGHSDHTATAAIQSSMKWDGRSGRLGTSGTPPNCND